MTRRPTPVRWLKEHPLLADSLLAGLLLVIVILSITGGDTSAHGVTYRDANALAFILGALSAVAAERARIARELHDVVAHNVSVMVVQAGAARRTIERDPERAREALTSVEDTGRQALDEMRCLLGVLRTEDDATEQRAPQPGISDLDSLVAHVRDAGLPVELVVEGQPRPLMSGADMSAYRIVQEALTNSLKHAGPARAQVVLRYGEHDLRVEVVDDGRGLAADT